MASTQDKAKRLDDLAVEERLLTSLRKRSGRATIGDVVVDTGLPAERAEQHLRRLLNLYQSHLEVDEHGEILYIFDPSLRRRGAGDSLKRTVRAVLRGAWKTFVFLFKIAIMVTLVVYFILFVVLIIAAFIAMSSRGDSSSSGRRSFPLSGIGWIFWSSPSPSYGHSSGGWSGGERAEEKPKEPFYKRIFAYVFGPEANMDLPADPFADEKEILTLIRANRGLITAPELVAHTGWERHRAEEELGRLLGAYEGDVRVTPNGTLLYTFEKLAVSAGQGQRPEPARPSWDRYERSRELTGNTTGTNVLITFINGFNLLAAFIAPAFIMPALELQGPLWYIVLSAFPLLFSMVFFAVPLLRIPFVLYENAQRAVRNTRRFVLAELFRRTERRENVFERDVVTSIARHWPEDAGGSASEPQSRAAFKRATVEFEPEVLASPSGENYYQFVQLNRELDEGRRARDLIDPAQLRLGRIVFSSAEPDLGIDQLEDFDQQVSGRPKALPADRLRQLDGELDGFDARLAQPGGAAPGDEAARARLDDFEARLAAAQEEEATTGAEAGRGGRRR